VAASGESCRDSGHGFSSFFDPERTPTMHRSTTKSAVPKGTTFGTERFGEPAAESMAAQLARETWRS
jgi:hypothetical protein